RVRNSDVPYRNTTDSTMATPSFDIRSASHFGTRPPCSGRSATPERFISFIVSIRWAKAGPDHKFVGVPIDRRARIQQCVRLRAIFARIEFPFFGVRLNSEELQCV